jgi:hypothetical protein
MCTSAYARTLRAAPAGSPRSRSPSATPSASRSGEAGDLDRHVRHPLHGGDGDQHAKGPVVAAGVAHGVQVRAEHQRRAVAATADQVADRVLVRREARLLHPAGDERVGAAHRVGAVAADEQAVLLADRAEAGAALEHRGGVAQLPRYVL